SYFLMDREHHRKQFYRKKFNTFFPILATLQINNYICSTKNHLMKLKLLLLLCIGSFSVMGKSSEALLERHRMWLNLSNPEVVFNQILVGYIENATMGKDTGIDAVMFGYEGNALYSLIENE